jgi:hypothetical protein
VVVLRRAASAGALAGAIVLLGCFQELGSFEGSGGRAGAAGSDQDVPAGPSGGSGPATATGEPAQESCQNDIDDDGDGKTDCQDEDCGGFVCVPLPIDEHASFPAVVTASAGDACTGAYTEQLVEGELLVAAPSRCGCVCGGASGGTCLATVTPYTDDACGTALAPLSFAACATTAGVFGSVRATITPAGAACAASEAPFDPPVFEHRRVCHGPRGGGCDAGFTCARLPAASTPGICFVSEGPCADPVYKEPRVVYAQTPEDARSCMPATCTCSAVGGSCSGTVELRDGACSSTVVATPATGGVCVDLVPNASAGSATLSGAAVTQAPGCAPDPRAETGGFVGEATPLCCSGPL